jgi:hypothetical protein
MTTPARQKASKKREREVKSLLKAFAQLKDTKEESDISG